MRDLSGGEKGRLALAKLIYSGVNVLVLDEPTNHLDIPSREALEEALQAYEGTIVTISHDRFFLDRVATQMLALDGAGNVEHYNGDYTEYHDWKAGRSVSSASADAIEPQSATGSEDRPSARARSRKRVAVNDGTTRGKKSGSSASTDESKRPIDPSKIKIVKRARDPEIIEAEITELEKRIAELSSEMTKPAIARDITKLVVVNDEYERSEAQLALLLDEWERAETAAIPSVKNAKRG